MKKYWALAKTSFQNSLVYRADSFLWGIGELVDTLVFLFIWMKIFGEGQAVAGFTLPETITYLIGVGLITNFIDTWVHYDLERDVQSGSLSNIIIRPVNYLFARFVTNVSEKPLNLMIRLGVYSLVALAFSSKFIANQNPVILLLCLFSIVFAVAINFLIDFLCGCIAFWTVRTRGTFGIFRAVKAIFAGGYAPITFFPPLFQKIAYSLPFAYTRYFPMLIYLKKISGGEVFKGFLIQIFWIAILYLISKHLWQKGLKRYEGVGI